MLTALGQPAPGPDEQAGSASRPHIERFGDDAWDLPTLPGERAALEALRWNWGEAYEIGCADGEWWFRRRDGKGGRETASTPDDLRAQIVLYYTFLPVLREPSAATPDQTDPTQEPTP